MTVTTCPPAIQAAGMQSVLGAYKAVFRASTEYWSGAWGRRSTPVDVALDVLEWATLASTRTTPTWASDFAVAATWPVARLLDFSEGLQDDSPATLILPPQAGHASCIVDYATNQSQVDTAKQSGLGRVFSLDWLGATEENKNSSIEEYLAVVAESVARLGGRVNLVGDCQGGWLAVIYAALHPEAVQTLTIAGAPVDFHSGGAVIREWMDVLTPFRNLAFYRSLVALNNGILPGEYQLAGFVAMQPEVELDRQLQLLAHLHEPEHVERYRRFETWFKHTQPVPGAFYLWIVEHLFQNNELVAGTLMVGDQRVDLANITCPLYLLAGSEDHITPGPQVFALADHAGTAAAKVVQRTAPGGHLGLFMGRESLQQYWAPLFAAIAADRPPVKVEAVVPASRRSRP